MTDRDLLEMALNALCDFDYDKRQQAIAAIGAAIEASEQPDLARVGEVGVWGEPVAMRWDFDGYGYRYIDAGSGSNWQTRVKDAEPLYKHPQREWQGLTEEDISEIYIKWDKATGVSMADFARAIEAKLKEKND